MSKHTMFDPIVADLTALETELNRIVASPSELVADIGGHLVEAGGKRLRPALYFLAARCGDFRTKKTLPLGAAIELIHMATLVHDDVIDSADTRRGYLTANARWGNQIAVLGGDYFFAKAFSLVARNRYDYRVMEILADVVCDLSEGEIVQNKETYRAGHDRDEYFVRIAKKTANFIAASCQLGGIVAGLSEKELDALWKYGYAIGMAYQITDDILDITATSGQLGKPVGNDLKQGIVTLPVIRALEISPEADALAKIAATRDMGDELVARGLAIVHGTDAVEYAYQTVGSFLADARAALPKSMPHEIRDAYTCVADFIALRNF